MKHYARRIVPGRPFRYHASVRQFEAAILENARIADSWRELVFTWDEGAGEPEPGQFLTLRVSSFSDPLLRRPFAFSSYRRAIPGNVAADAEGARASIVYQIRGGATRLLSELAPGARIDALGPLGKGFGLPADDERPIVAGGGVGLGPLLFLAERLSSPERKAAGLPRPILAIGFRSVSLLPSIALPEGAVICTDDGSAGFHGTPVDWISRAMAEGHGEGPDGSVRLYGCGPLPMLAALADLAAERGWPARLSAEQWMACGVGACMGCALPRSDGLGFLRACADGPVFDSGDIDWRAGP
jgi:dihydroorotate dehydrogenase electron transfer subunit